MDNYKLKPVTNLLQINILIALGLMNSAAYAACVDNGSGTYVCDDLIYSNTVREIQGGPHNFVVTTTAMASGVKGYGYYGNGFHITVNDFKVTTSGYNADAIRLLSDGRLYVQGNLDIVTKGGGTADGVNLIDEGRGTILTVDGNTSIIASTGVGLRVNLGVNDSDTNQAYLNGTAYIETASTGGNTFDASGYAVYAGNRLYSAKASGKAIIEIKGDSTLTTSGSLAHVVYANRGGEITLGNTEITAKNMNAYGLFAESAMVKKSNVDVEVRAGKIHLTGDTRINSGLTYEEGRTAIYAQGLNGVASEIKSTNAAQYNIVGNIKADGFSIVDLNMIDGSSIIGNTAIATDGIVNLTIAGSTSKWQMMANSELTTLNLSDNAQVFLGDQVTPITIGNQIILTAETLTGSGVFNMRADIPNQIGDIIKVTGSANGAHGIHIADHSTGGATVTGNEIVTLIEMADGAAQFGLLNKNSAGASTIDIGAYSYALNSKNTGGTAQEWYLSGSLIPIIPPVTPVDPPVTPVDPPVTPVDPPVTPVDPPVTPVDPPVTPVDPPVTPVDPVGPTLTNAANHSVNIFNINYLMNQAETHTLLQRMGELRGSDTLGGVWVRGYGGKFNSFSSELQDFDFKYTGIQFGVDRLLSNEYGRFYVGAMAGYVDGEAKYRIGKGEVKSYHLGLYTTFKHTNGFYVDGLIKYNTMRNTFTTQTGGGYAVNGKGTTSGLSASVEAGKRFYFQAKDNGWYIEPQAQVSYAHQGSTTIRSSNNLKTRLGSYDSLLGRMSVIVGYKITEGANPIDLYFKTGIVKEFNGKANYTFNGSDRRNEYKFDGTWWDSAIGINAQFNKKHNLYLDVNYAAGSKFNKAQLNFGYRYEF